jgi:hypothetical protein
MVFKQKPDRRDKGHYKLKKGTVQPEVITVLNICANIYVMNIRAMSS